MKNGARRPKLHELYGVNRKHKVQWKRQEINLVELANLRWIERWSVKRLSAHLDRKPDTIQMHLCKLRAGGLEELSLSPKDFRVLKKASKQVFKGLN